ncbi:MAG: hypothetical protein JW862_18235, partial [Anaerolineales bacterium]|nr:hypothetical protein [Anaerolineales bacterium]
DSPMNMSDERMMILKMIESGTVSADEGAKLLASVGEEKKIQPQRNSVAPASKGGAKWFRVRVTDTATGKNKALVSLPISLMDWGLRVGAHFAPEMEGLDLAELSEILREGAEGKIVDVLDEEDGEHVEIFIE